MLFFLTGNIQTGKTRWLEGLVKKLHGCGVRTYGVLAPGQWVRHENDVATNSQLSYEPTFEKLGIDNVLLPSGKRIEFARRRDLALGGVNEFASGKQAAAAQLGWAISDNAIAQVNSHFGELVALCTNNNETRILRECNGEGGEKQLPTAHERKEAKHASKNLLVIDELGRLELMRGAGLTNAVKLLELGSTDVFQTAIVIVRETLVDSAIERFNNAWGSCEKIYPTSEGEQKVRKALGC